MHEINTKWNLDALYGSEELLLNALKNIKISSKNFEKIYKNSLKILHVNEFLEAIKEYESISEKLGKIMTFAFLKFAQNSDNNIFYSKCNNETTKCSEHLLFFELEFNKLPIDKQKSIISFSNKYSYFLESLSKLRKHQLSQKEETILLKKDNTGASAFSRLFDEHFSKLVFNFRGKVISEEEILSYLHHDKREIRKEAAIVFSQELAKHQHLLAYIYNMIKADLKIDCELRKYQNAEEPRHIDNKISQKSVDSLIKSAEKNFNLVHEYYNAKKEILGFDELYDYDRYAPLEKDETIYSFENAKEIVLKTFKEFSPKFESIAQKAFNDGWIDIYPAQNKRSGAFSHPATTDTHPYILLNYTNQRRDLFTLAHELGHTIHQYLSKDAGYLASDTPLTTSETASVFAEMMVFDALKSEARKEDKKAMLAGKIEDIFATFYRQINFTTFERRIHAYDGELRADDFNNIWKDESKKMFGDSIKLLPHYDIWWSYIPHFIHSPFYCYAYSYGQLLVLALYGLYKSEKMEDFKEKYISFLSAGGGKSPAELVAFFGFNIEDEAFWEIGILEIKKLVDEFKEL